MANMYKRNKSYKGPKSRRRKVREASTNRMLENQYGVKFKNNLNFSPLTKYIIDYCSKGLAQDEWDLFN